MPKTIIKSKLQCYNYKTKTKTELNNNKSNLPPNLQAFHKNYYQDLDA